MRKFGFVLFIFALAGAAWSAAWFYVAHEAGVQFDAWLKSEDGQGRSWTCPERRVGGYPFAVSVACMKPSYTAQALEQTVTGGAAGVVATAAITDPRRLVVTLQSPLTYRTSDGQADVKASWSHLAIDIDGLPDAKTTALHATNLVVDGTFADVGREGGNAARLDATFTLAAQGDNPILDFAISARGSAVPPIDDLLGGRAAVDVDLAGRLDHADAGSARTPEEAIETWRQAGGRIALGPSRFSRADANVSGSGTMGLDDAHRLQGRLDASFVGLEPILKRYGISGNLAAAGSLLNALFGGGQPQAPPPTPGALNLPISFQNGRIGVGPIRTPIQLPPLY